MQCSARAYQGHEIREAGDFQQQNQRDWQQQHEIASK